MKIKIYYLALSFLLLIGCVKESKRIENQMIFSKVYGYVKYFHPSDEAAELDWKNFAIYGASQIDKCNSTSDVIEILEELFAPIAPTIKFSASISEFDSCINRPDSIEEFRHTYWQHEGVSTGMDNKWPTYKCRRVNRENNKESSQLFESSPKTDECIIKQIGKGIFCQIPITVYCNDGYTFPRSNQNKIKRLKEELKPLKYLKASNLYTRLGNMTNVYNVFQHFYPYFDVVDINWEAEFKNALKVSYTDETNLEHFISLQKFTASLKDGHVRVSNSSIRQYYIPPITWEWVEDKLIITQVEAENDSIKIGDVVTQINGKSSEHYFDEVYSRISVATAGYLNHRANSSSLLGDFCSHIGIVIDGKEYKLKRTINYYEWLQNTNNKTKYKEVAKGIWYLNLDIVEMDTINKLLPMLVKCKSIICDLRGYPNGNHGIIQHLLAIDDTTSSWMQIPQVVYPDQDRIIGYKKGNWISLMNSKKPYLGDKKVIFLTDGRAISYAESIMGYVKGYNLATIIGQPTAGTNGNVNHFTLHGGYKISWTGMKVVKHDGLQLHGVGILPDIYLNKTIQGIKEGRDEFLEIAIELAMQ